MIIPDVNVLMYAINESVTQHRACRYWLDMALASEEIALPDLVWVAVVRLGSNPSIYPELAQSRVVFGFVASLMEYPNVYRIASTAGTTIRFNRLCESLQLSGNDVNDAYLAALAMENDATLCSADGGFARFPGLKILNPLAGEPV